MDRGAWWAIVHGVAKSGTGLSDLNNNNMRQNHHLGIRDVLNQFSIVDH